LEPNNDVKEVLNALIFSVLFVMFFVILMPVLLKFMDARAGKIAYALLSAAAVALAVRLRALARRI
jgi:hypothetical protein